MLCGNNCFFSSSPVWNMYIKLFMQPYLPIASLLFKTMYYVMCVIRHVGDLGNIYPDNMGHVRTTLTDSVIHLQGEHSIMGRAIVVSILLLTSPILNQVKVALHIPLIMRCYILCCSLFCQLWQMTSWQHTLCHMNNNAQEWTVLKFLKDLIEYAKWA